MDQMEEFFEKYEQWKPLFQSLISGPDAPAASILLNSDAGDGESMQCWKDRPNVPPGEEDQLVVGLFLEDMQK